jgi:Peptidase A4 family
MAKLFVLCALAALAFAVAGAASPATGARSAVAHSARLTPNHKITQSTSSNWSGYSAINGRYTTVSASWTQPTASCTSQTTYSSFWVGLDGDGSSTVEQTGTSADCSGGRPSYYAWYEMYPKFPVNLSLPVKPGDSISASVTTSGNGRFTLTITNNTAHATYQTTQNLKRAKLASAEVIAEAPSSSGGVLPLTNFGTASFSAATVNGVSIGSWNPDRIDMVSNGVTKAVTSALSGGTSFSVSWRHS